MNTEETTTVNETESSNIVPIVVTVVAVASGATVLWKLKRRYDRKREEAAVEIMMEAFQAEMTKIQSEQKPSK